MASAPAKAGAVAGLTCTKAKVGRLDTCSLGPMFGSVKFFFLNSHQVCSKVDCHCPLFAAVLQLKLLLFGHPTTITTPAKPAALTCWTPLIEKFQPGWLLAVVDL